MSMLVATDNKNSWASVPAILQRLERPKRALAAKLYHFSKDKISLNISMFTCCRNNIYSMNISLKTVILTAVDFDCVVVPYIGTGCQGTEAITVGCTLYSRDFFIIIIK